MDKLKKTLSERPVSFPVGMVAFVLYVLGMSLPAVSLFIAASFCFSGALILAMWFDL